MRVITLANTKGGTAKSTIATNLAVAAGEAGERVFALDLDPQQTFGNWINRREAETPGFAAIKDAATFKAGLDDIRKQGFSVVIVDTAGSDSALLNTALSASDLVLIPSRPTTADLEATNAVIRAVNLLARPFGFIISQAPVRSSRTNEAIAGLKMMGRVLSPPLSYRTDFQDAISAGQGVIEYAPNSKAAQEVRELWASVQAYK